MKLFTKGLERLPKQFLQPYATDYSYQTAYDPQQQDRQYTDVQYTGCRIDEL